MRGDESLAALVEFMDRRGYNWDQEFGEFVPRPDGPARGRMTLNVRGALGLVDPGRYTDQSGDIRNLPSPRWPGWMR